MMEWIIGFLPKILYVFSAFDLVSDMYARENRLRRRATTSLAVGFGIDTVQLFLRYSKHFSQGQLPISGPSDALSMFSWSLVAIVLVVQMQNRLFSVAALLTSLAALLGLLAYLVSDRYVPLTSGVSGILLVSHIVVFLIGMGIICLAFLTAVIYLFQQRSLKTKQLGRFFGVFPPLETLDALTVKALIVGTLFLTIGVCSGIYLAHQRGNTDWIKDPKIILSFFAWLWYLLLLGVRFRLGWRGTRFFTFILIGFLILVFTFVGVYAFFYGAHPTLETAQLIKVEATCRMLLF